MRLRAGQDRKQIYSRDLEMLWRTSGNDDCAGGGANPKGCRGVEAGCVARFSAVRRSCRVSRVVMNLRRLLCRLTVGSADFGRRDGTGNHGLSTVWRTFPFWSCAAGIRIPAPTIVRVRDARTPQQPRAGGSGYACFNDVCRPFTVTAVGEVPASRRMWPSRFCEVAFSGSDCPPLRFCVISRPAAVVARICSVELADVCLLGPGALPVDVSDVAGRRRPRSRYGHKIPVLCSPGNWLPGCI